MGPTIRRRLLRAAALCALLALAGPSTAAAGSGHVAVPDTQPGWATQANDQGAAPNSRQMVFSVWLGWRDAAGLDGRNTLPEEFLREKKYDIGKVVAKGGMGAILDAKEATTERTVAMKVMLEAHDADGLAHLEDVHLSAAAQRAGADDQLHRFRDRHEVALHALVRDRHRAAERDLAAVSASSSSKSM